MSKEGDLHSGLMARVESLVGVTLIWPQKGGEQPAGEFIKVDHLPNDNSRVFIGHSDPLDVRGFVVLTLVGELGVFEAVTKERAGAIADHFPIGFEFIDGVCVHAVSVRAGSQGRDRWETRIWIDYRGQL